MKRYLFFLRHHNDIDNISPAIYFLLKSDDNIRVDILIYSDDYDFRDDINLNFLIDYYKERIKITWLGELIGLNPIVVFDSKFTRYIYKQVGRLYTSKSVNHVRSGRRVSVDKTAEILNDWVLNPVKPVTVVFDQNRSVMIKNLVLALRKLGITKIISLPVSPFMNVNTLRSDDMINLSTALLKRKHDYSLFDKVGLVDSHYMKSLERTYSLLGLNSPLDQIGVPLGSIRYSPEWLEVRKREYFDDDKINFEENTNGKITLTFLLSNSRTNSFWSEVKRSIQFMSEFKEYDIIVKPHPREKISDLPISDNIRIDTSTPSSVLIDQSDLIVYWGTSVALEGFIKKKYMACLDYVNGNNSVFRMFEPGYMMKCRDDLHFLLKMFSSNRKSIPYNQSGIDKLIYNVVSAGVSEDITERYVRFINQKIL